MGAHVSGWEALRTGKLQEAFRLLKQEYEEAPSAGALNNLGTALMELGRYEEARHTFEHALELEKRDGGWCEGTQVKIGLAQWFMGRAPEAIAAWRLSLDSDFADAAGGVLGPLMLWYGGLRTADNKTQSEAVKLLRKFWKIKDSAMIKNWPGPAALAGYLLEKVSEDVLLDRWRESNPILEARRKARAHFWVGVRSQRNDAARMHFQKVVSEDRIAILEPEYFLAKWEYHRLTSQLS